MRPQFARAVAVFTAAFMTIVIVAAGVTASKGQGLPVVERPSPLRSDTLAVLVTGDGGWRALDRDLAQRSERARRLGCRTCGA